jgi:hypothetical protein
MFEMEMVEAVALFDYNGRTNKELSFRKNQIIFIYKKMNREWWLGHLAGGNQSGFIPDGYIKLKSRRRDSAPVQHLPSLSFTPNPSSSLHSIDLTTSSNDQLDANVYRPSSDFSLVDEHRLESAKETAILGVDSDIDHEEHTDPMPAYRTIYDVLPPSPPSPISTTDHPLSSSSSSSSSHLTSTNDQQIIDIDTALREVLSGIRTVEECHAECFRSIPSANTQPETDAPDLVLNLPISTGLITPPASKSLDEHPSSILHSTIIIDLKPERIPPPIMKKPEKTLELIHRLGLTETSSGQFNLTHRQKQQAISISGSSKATEV